MVQEIEIVETGVISHLTQLRTGSNSRWGHPGLPDTWFSGQHHNPAVTRYSGIHGGAKASHFALAADEYPPRLA